MSNKQTDYQTIINILDDVWNTARLAIPPYELQERITLNAKAHELIQLLEMRGLLMRDGMLMYASFTDDLVAK